MKCLSVRQPWATWIFDRGKDVENRTWCTGYRGPLLIHAAKAVDDEALNMYGERWDSHRFVRGAVIGVVDLIGMRSPYTPEEKRSKWHCAGQYGWALARPRLFRIPVALRGQLGLFDVDVAEILSQAI